MNDMTGRVPADDNDWLSHTQLHIKHSCGNVTSLLARREISPRTKCLPKKHWGEPPKRNHNSRDARSSLYSWVEAESLGLLSAKYCSLMPPPRSTIAVSFSSDAKSLASTHGDHTIKIIDPETGRCVKVFRGHQRTPWTVKFHPKDHELLVSGSLDCEVRLWDTTTSECIGSCDFNRPIASLAFHPQGDLLAVASGRKLYLWHDIRTEGTSPVIVLKTRRSLRAVHFHPYAAPFLLTAEVGDLDSSDSSVIHATSLCSVHSHPPQHRSDVLSRDLSMAAELPTMSPFLDHSSSARSDMSDRQNSSNFIQRDSSASTDPEVNAVRVSTDDHQVSTLDAPLVSVDALGAASSASTNYLGDQFPTFDPSNDAMEIAEFQDRQSYQTNLHIQSTPLPEIDPSPVIPYHLVVPSTFSGESSSSVHRLGQSLSSASSTYWGLPSVQGWLMGQFQVEHPILPWSSGVHELPLDQSRVDAASVTPESSVNNREYAASSLATPSNMHFPIIPDMSSLQGDLLHSIPLSDNRRGLVGVPPLPLFGAISPEFSTLISAGTGAGAELPFTVKLRIWLHDVKNPCARLDVEKCRLTIPHAVLCSDMGAHFSPCGRYLVACVACMLPQMESDHGFMSQLNQDSGGALMSPTRHPVSARKVIYELRIYSLEGSTFGSVLVSRVVRAAHCLTSIQFSPTSEHVLLAYGRRHLLSGIIVNGDRPSLPVYTVLEIYRVSDLQLVSSLPSSEDEVNICCFHPSPGGGLVYGTKEGKLRFLQFDRNRTLNSSRSYVFPMTNMIQ